MKNIIIVIFSMMILTSCDPDVPGEGVSLDPIDFSFTVGKDTGIQFLGDTILFSSKELNNNNLNGGELKIFMSIYYFDVDTIRTPDDSQRAYENNEYEIIFNSGNYTNHSTGFLREIELYPKGEDSLYYNFELIPLKTGIFKIVFRSSFYEGPDGKARTNAKFDVTSPHWEFYTPSLREIAPTDDRYYRSFLFRVE